MGKQFRFIMDEADEEAFFEYVKNNGRIFQPKRIEGTVEIYKIPERFWINLYLYRNDIGTILFEDIRGRAYIDTTVSSVIEFSETIVRENVNEIERGRLYVEMRYYNEEGEIVQKSELLDKWYKELIRWIKKRLQCVKINYDDRVVKEYVSKSLVNLVEEGYHLLG